MKNFQIEDRDTGKMYWISRSMAVHGVLLLHNFKDNQIWVLLEKRGPGCPDEIGKWADPTGYLDWDETLKEALYREVWEELGLNLGDLDLCKITLDGIHDSVVDNKLQNVTVRYIVNLDWDEIQPLLRRGIINTDTESRGGEKDEVSDINTIKIYPRDTTIDKPGFFAFNHGDIINRLIKHYNNL